MMPGGNFPADFGLRQKQGGDGAPDENISSLFASQPPFPSPSIFVAIPSSTADNPSKINEAKTSTTLATETSSEQASLTPQPVPIISSQTSIYTSAGEITNTRATVGFPSSAHPHPPLQQEPGNDSSSENRAQIIGVVIGVLAFLTIFFCVGWIWLRRRRNNAQAVDGMLERAAISHTPYPPSTPNSTTSSQIYPFTNQRTVCPSLAVNFPWETRGRLYDEDMHQAAAMGLGSSGLAMAAINNSNNSSSTALVPGSAVSEVATSIYEPSSAPIQVGRLARPFSGAALVTVPAVLPSYEESQSHAADSQQQHSQERGRDLTINAIFNPSITAHSEDLEAEYEAEAARMAGFVAPARTLDAQRESADSGSTSRRLRDTFGSSWGRDIKRASSRGPVDDAS